MSPNDGTDHTRIERRTLELVLDLEFPDSCPLSDVPDDVSDIFLQIHGDGCELEFLDASNRTGSQITHFSTKWERDTEACNCPCFVFAEHDSVPHVRGGRDGAVTVVTYPPSQKCGRELVQALQRECGSVTTVEAHSPRSAQTSQQRTVDLGRLSTSQRTALRNAVGRGFFEPDDETTLETLATKLGISPSAYSQRLDRAKSVIFDQLFD